MQTVHGSMHGAGTPFGVRIRWLVVLAGLTFALAGAMPAAALGAALKTEWSAESPAASPPEDEGAAMAYDMRTGQLVLFGGFSKGAYSAKTWAYEGSSWVKQSPVSHPSGRVGASAAYDPATGQLVLFGGMTSAGPSAETWTYEGSNGWGHQSPAESPPARQGASMAYDPASKQLILYGGTTESGVSAETWVYEGSAGWVKESPAESPPAREGASLVYDPAGEQLILFGGYTANGYAENADSAETWAYNGTTWVQLSPAESPPARYGASIAYDQASAQVVMFGGDTEGSEGSETGENGESSETWVYEGSSWVKQSFAGGPSPRSFASMGYDPATDQLVLFGGFVGSLASSETWIYGVEPEPSGEWTRQSTTPSPPATFSAAMAFDSVTDQMNMFSARTIEGGATAETWMHDALGWTQASPAQSPPALEGGSMAFDPELGETVLFGGQAEGGAISHKTWAYDGSSWTQESPSQSPPGHADASMAFDYATGQLVLFGGYVPVTGLSDETWTYNGLLWTKQSPAESPSVREGAAIAYDPATEQLILYGGTTYHGASDETWVYERSGDWVKQSPAESPPALYSATMAYDPATERMILYGEYIEVGASPSGAGTWAYNGTSWVQQSSTSWVQQSSSEGPPQFEDAAMAFDPVAGQAVLFGSNPLARAGQQTWLYEPSTKQVTAIAFSASEVARVGESVSGSVALSGASSPTGSITFKLFGPDNLFCSGAPAFQASESVNGDGSYRSAAFTPTAAGTYRWLASYSGDAGNHAVAGTCGEPGTLLTVLEGPQRIDFPAIADHVLGEGPLTLSATTSAGLPVSFASATGNVCTVSGSSATLLAAGTCTIVASQPGNGNYEAAPEVSRSFLVASAPKVCPRVRARLSRYSPRPPRKRKRMARRRGVQAKLSVDSSVRLRLRFVLVYRLKGRSHRVLLDKRTQRKGGGTAHLRLTLPARLQRHLRVGHRVKLLLRARAIGKRPSGCATDDQRSLLRTRVAKLYVPRRRAKGSR